VELHKAGIPLTLITDNMVGHFLKTGKVGAIVTGADRIAANGDTPTKSARTRSQFWQKRTKSRFTSPHPSPLLIYPFRMASTFPLKSAPRLKSRICRAFASLLMFTPRILRLT